ncbi:putative F-box protein [Arabidopsis thaliana]|uniref:F-box domain-containing protein n=2 Tax=Arabidopsis TaxID=3701 RepID=A0A178UDK1_ARATH|nr:F-box domain [Arabidopsis thaliana x Arabidopsis arenosa]OAO91690.1 hypothetical protein AXX17_AT5G39270 [Arabidopsis thaliana]
MATMISNLPRDLIEEIFSRVPLTSMKAVRLTCKSWNNLSKSESFTKVHIGRAATREEKTMIVDVMPHKLNLMSIVIDDVTPSAEFKGQFSLLHKNYRINQVLHYEGLLLCIMKDPTRIVVWNPYLGQTRWIQLRYFHRPHGIDHFRYALGYADKESCSSLKFLRFLDYFYKAPEEEFFWYEIYDFDSGLWTTLNVTPHWGIYSTYPCVSLKGNTYWPAKERSTQGFQDYIIGFDFTRERFGPLLALPTDRECSFVSLSCVKEEKLAALFKHRLHHDSYEYEFEIWITTKIDVEMVSWSKFLRMDMRPKIELPLTFYIDEEKKVFMGFDHGEYPKLLFLNVIGETGFLRKLENIQYHSPCSYVPSLVQVKKLARDRLRKQRSLENRRFAQNILRLARNGKS